ncbi:amidohydrolase, partial [Staphylococcus aureus]
MRDFSTAISNNLPELTALRHDLHAHPELGLEEKRTSEIIARQLEALGYKVTRGLAKTGVIGTLTNGSGRKSVGIRADIDALPIHEQTNLPYSS